MDTAGPADRQVAEVVKALHLHRPRWGALLGKSRPISLMAMTRIGGKPTQDLDVRR